MGGEYTAKRTLLRGKSRSQPSLDNFVLRQIFIALLAYNWEAYQISALRQSITLLKSFHLADDVCIYRVSEYRALNPGVSALKPTHLAPSVKS